MSSIARLPAVLLASLTVSSAFAQGEANVVCSAPITWCEATAAAFHRATGVDVNLTLKSADEAAAQIAYERADPKHDLWFGGAGYRHMQIADAGLTEEYRSLAAAAIARLGHAPGGALGVAHGGALCRRARNRVQR